MSDLKKKAAEGKTSRLRKYSRRNKTKDEVKVSRVDLSENTIYEILQNESVPSEQRMEQIAELIKLDLSSITSAEQTQQYIKMVKDIVKELLSKFTQHNRKSIELTRDNPLGKLKQGIEEVFQNYHTVSTGRDDIKGRLGTIDTLLAEIGGEDKLIVAMVEAQTKTAEMEAQQAKIDNLRQSERLVESEYDVHDNEVREEHSIINNLNDKAFAFMRPGVQAELVQARSRKSAATTKRNAASAERQAVVSERKAEELKLVEMKTSDDYHIHQQILSILDIASPEFKDKLKELAEAMLTYIDDTEITLTEVRDQLEELMKDVDKGLDVNINIREHVAILSQAMQTANDSSIKVLQDYKSQDSSSSSSVMNLERDKVSRIGDQVVSSLSATTTSVTMISSEVQKIEVVLMSLQDQLGDGLMDADEQLLMAVNTASASGMIMLNRAQTLGTLAQAVVARGQYMAESEETFGQLADEFERGLAVKAGRNDTIASLSSVVADITNALEDRNDVATEIAVEKRQLVNNLSEQIENLRQAAESTRELESRVNEQLAEG